MTDRLIEDSPEWEKLDPEHPVLKALQAERQARRESERREKLAVVRSKFPNTELTDEDFEGLTPDKFEARAQRIASLSQPVNEPEPEPRREVRREEGAFERMQRSGFEGTVPEGGERIISDVNEAFALFKRNPAEFDRLRQAGRVKLGVRAEDRGGSVIFHAE